LLLLLLPLLTHAQIPSDPVSCWPFDEASGVRSDLYGGNDLADNNTVGVGTAIVAGNSADFERDNQEYLSITDALQTGLDLGVGGSDFSVMGWVRFETNVFTGLVAKYNLPLDASYSLRKFADNTTEIWTDLSVNGSTISQNGGNLAGQTNWATATDYFIYFGYDASSGQMNFSVNDGTVLTVGSFPTSVHNGNANFTIGVGYVPGGEYMDGLMDEWSVFARQLSAGEITSMYNAGAGVPCVDLAPTPENLIVNPVDGSLLVMLESTTCTSTATSTTCSYEYDDSAASTTATILGFGANFELMLGVLVFGFSFLGVAWVFMKFTRKKYAH